MYLCKKKFDAVLKQLGNVLSWEVVSMCWGCSVVAVWGIAYIGVRWCPRVCYVWWWWWCHWGVLAGLTCLLWCLCLLPSYPDMWAVTGAFLGLATWSVAVESDCNTPLLNEFRNYIVNRKLGRVHWRNWKLYSFQHYEKKLKRKVTWKRSKTVCIKAYWRGFTEDSFTNHLSLNA